MPQSESYARPYNWDLYFDRLSGADMRSRSPLLRGRLHPTAYNEDGSRLYLGSLDVDVATEDYAKISSLREEIAGALEKDYADLLDRVKAQHQANGKRLLEGRPIHDVTIAEHGDYRRTLLRVDRDELTDLLSRRKDV